MNSVPLTEEELAALTPAERADLMTDEARTQVVDGEAPADRAARVPPAENWIAGRLRSAAQCGFPPRRAFFARQAALAAERRGHILEAQRPLWRGGFLVRNKFGGSCMECAAPIGESTGWVRRAPGGNRTVCHSCAWKRVNPS